MQSRHFQQRGGESVGLGLFGCLLVADFGSRVCASTRSRPEPSAIRTNWMCSGRKQEQLALSCCAGREVSLVEQVLGPLNCVKEVEAGAGQIAKCANQIMVAAQMAGS